eukprot:Nk52_evm36s62 gene=Nk52_evmTU36s62
MVKAKSLGVDVFTSPHAKANPFDPKSLLVGSVSAAAPVYMFCNVLGMPFMTNSAFFSIVTIVMGFVLSFNYAKVIDTLKPRIEGTREEAVAEHFLADKTKNGKKLTMKNIDNSQYIEFRTELDSVAYNQAMYLSLAFNNGLFFMLMMVLSNIVLVDFEPFNNYLLSIVGSMGLTTFINFM